MKICTKCNTKKEETFFSKDKKGKAGLHSQCKSCIKTYQQNNKKNITKARRIRAKNNKEKIKITIKKWREKNKETIRIKTKEYKENNKKILNEKSKIYWQNNKDKKRLKNKRYREKNKAKRNEKEKNKRINDILYKLRGNIRTLIGHSIRKGGFKKSSETAKILGCTFEEFKIHLKSKFEKWMNWNNYGVFTGNYNETWNIDHIIPVSIGKSLEEIYKLNHFTNLQPLCSKKNQDKKAKLDYV